MVADATWEVGPDPSPKQARELERVERRLMEEFTPQLAPHIVSDVVHHVFDSWSGARVRTFIPLLTERYAREELRHFHR